MLVKSAYMRIYLPSEETTVSVAGLPDVADAAPRSVVDGSWGLLDASMTDGVLRAAYRGRQFVCPRRPRLRVLESVLAFHNGYADIGGEVLIPESVARRAAEELALLRDREPEQRSHILESPWHVPLRWFVAFAPDEREVFERSGRPAIRYRTLRSAASKRLHSALEVLDDIGMDASVVDDLADYSDWIDEFPVGALVELDYGSVAGMFDGADLIVDESVSEVWASIESLRAGDWDQAGRFYSQVATRWAPGMSVVYSN